MEQEPNYTVFIVAAALKKARIWKSRVIVFCPNDINKLTEQCKYVFGWKIIKTACCSMYPNAPFGKAA